MTNEHKCRKIVGTCVKIMYEVWRANPLCSFGFIGANTYDPITRTEEKIDNTQRWRIYKHAMENHFGTETFAHGDQERNSSYVMLNKKKDVEELSGKLTGMFSQLYYKD
ncbi:hypothetical protein [Pedobacter helvus]|uniref:Uncharacterized protein n=1 Tax=Pedobacter helvus TaxID=2563444 RepID=A0ABW9JPE0_9SPHI|nr:hypothetical protein [Pedobacter ureilyticus]